VDQDGRVTDRTSPSTDAEHGGVAPEADDVRHLDHACALATEAASTDGGPFGAIVVQGGQVVSTGTNRVTADHDPTAHAEVVALRAAGRALGTNDLTGCVLYASCQPCPMCQAAAWWARVDRVVYAATEDDAAAAGFDDAGFWAAMRGTGAAPTPTHHVPTAAALEPFEAWIANPDRVRY
jgi:guanine deaminase